MTPLTIPLAPGLPFTVQTVTLDGRRYIFRTRWLQRIQRWQFDLETDSGTVLILSKGLSVRCDLLAQVRYSPLCPGGTLVLVDSQGATVEGESEATLSSLGDRHRLIYFPAE